MFLGHDHALHDRHGQLATKLKPSYCLGIVDSELFADPHRTAHGKVDGTYGYHRGHEAVDIAVRVFRDNSIFDWWWDDILGLIPAVEALGGFFARLPLHVFDFALAGQSDGANGDEFEGSFSLFDLPSLFVPAFS